MRKLVIGLFATILFAVLLVGGVALARPDEPKIEKSVSLVGRTGPSGGYDAGEQCLLTGFAPTEELGDQTKITGFVSLTQSPGFGPSTATKAATIRVLNIAISGGDGSKVATLTGFVINDFGYSQSLLDFAVSDVTIVADEAARTIVLTLDTNSDNGGPIQYTFSGVGPDGFPKVIVVIED